MKSLYVSKLLTEFLEEKAISQVEFSNLTGVSATSISNAQGKGSKVPGIGKKTALTIYEYLRDKNLIQVEFDEFFTKIESKSQQLTYRKQFEVAVKNHLAEHKVKQKIASTVSAFATDTKGADQGTIFTAVSHAIKRLENSGGLVFVVGSAGIGKTTSCLYFAKTQANTWLSDMANHYLPINFDLRKYDFDVELSNWFSNQLEKDDFHITPSFAEGMRKERIVPVLDGLGEVARSHGLEKTQALLEELQKFATEEPSAIVISADKIFFENQLASRTEDFAAVFEIKSFSPEQIAEGINRRVPVSDHDIRLSLLEHAERNRQLLQHPFILRTFIDLGPRVPSMKTRGELFRDISKGIEKKILEKRLLDEPSSTQTSDFHALLCSIAFQMFSDGTDEISEESILELLKLDNLIFDSIESLEVISILIRTGEGNFKFIDDSIRNYYVASKISIDLASKNLVCTIGERVLYEEVYQFLGELFWCSNGHRNLIRTLENPQNKSLVRFNCVPTIRKLLWVLEPEDKREILELLIKIHMDATQDSDLLRYICGYTAEEFFHSLRDDGCDIENIASSIGRIETDNHLLSCCNAHLVKACRKDIDEKELAREIMQPLTASASGSMFINDEKGLLKAYVRVLELDSALPAVIRESIRIASVYQLCSSNKKALELSNNSDLVQQIFSRILDRNLVSSFVTNYHQNPNYFADQVCSVIPWAISFLGLTKLDSSRGLIELSDKDEAKSILTKLSEINDSFVSVMANIALHQE